MLSNGRNDKAIYLKIMGLKEKTPHFERKVGEEITTFTQVEGDFVGVTFKDITWNDEGKEKKRRVFDVTLQDGGEEYHVQSWFTQVGRSLLNTLISKDQHWRLCLSLYVNKSWYPSIGVFTKDSETQDDMVMWKLSIDEQKAMTKELSLNWETVYDRSELDAYLEKEASLLTARDDVKGETNFDRPLEELTKPTKAKLDKKAPKAMPEELYPF